MQTPLTSNEDVTALVDTISTVTEEVMKRFGRHDFMAIVYVSSPEGTRYFGVSMNQLMSRAEREWADGKRSEFYTTKNYMEAALRSLLQREGATGIMLIGEAWEKSIRRKDLRTIGGDDESKGQILAPNPRDSEDKIEILFMTWEFKLPDGSKVHGLRRWEILRNGEVVTLGQRTDRIGGEGFGRFCNLIG